MKIEILESPAAGPSLLRGNRAKIDPAMPKAPTLSWPEYSGNVIQMMRPLLPKWKEFWTAFILPIAVYITLILDEEASLHIHKIHSINTLLKQLEINYTIVR